MVSISPPAMKMRGSADWMMTTRTSGRAVVPAQTAFISRTISRSKALPRSGRLSVIVATPACGKSAVMRDSVTRHLPCFLTERSVEYRLAVRSAIDGAERRSAEVGVDFALSEEQRLIQHGVREAV